MKSDTLTAFADAPSDSALDLPISNNARRLTAAEKEQYAREGYVKNLPVFADAALPLLQDKFQELNALLPPTTHISLVNNWHKAHPFCWSLIHTSAIIDYVEDLIGPNIAVWGHQFFVKFPGDGTIVPFHQDSQYWPLTPRRTVTAWIAFNDVDEDNGAMQVVRQSHRRGEYVHHNNDDPNYVLNQEVDEAAIDPQDIVTLDLKAGQISLHDDGLLHGSPANSSDRLRTGATIRFIPTDVKCDLDVWPTFETTLVRGVDTRQLNPVCKPPTAKQCPERKFQHSSEFR